jgi:hypothetical protein
LRPCRRLATLMRPSQPVRHSGRCGTNASSARVCVPGSLLSEAVQQRLDGNPQALRVKMRMGATHFLMRRLPKVATEMALHVLAYNLTRVMNIIGVQALVAAIRTCLAKRCCSNE